MLEDSLEVEILHWDAALLLDSKPLGRSVEHTYIDRLDVVR